MGFLVDSSGSINTADSLNYQRIKDFIKGFIRSVIIGENDTRIGLATFSGESTFKVRISFTHFFTTDSLINAVEMIPYDSGGTRTGEALDRIRTDLFSMAREGLPRILVVLTDGKSQDSVTAPSRLLRQMGVQIISVGVGDAVYEELADMASEPDSENIYDVTFESLSNLTGSLLDSICKGKQLSSFRIMVLSCLAFITQLFIGTSVLARRPSSRPKDGHFSEIGDFRRSVLGGNLRHSVVNVTKQCV